MLIATAVILLPFVDKAFHIDDPVFLRIGEEILVRPFKPYSFTYSWSGVPGPMWLQSNHPPLFSYYLAAVAATVGLSEIAVHLACLPFAIGCAWFMHKLAGRFCNSPTLATVLSIISPAFLVSSTTVMADVPMLFFWLWAVWATVQAADQSRPMRLWLAAFAGSAAAMTKYFGIAIVPLLLVYWYARKRHNTVARPGRVSLHVLALWSPVFVLGAWGFYSFVEYGKFHPLGAAGTAVEAKTLLTHAQYGWHTIGFVGGSTIWPLGLLVLFPRFHRLARWGLAVLMPIAMVVRVWQLNWFRLEIWTAHPLYATLDSTFYAAMFVAGTLAIAVSIRELRNWQDPDSLLIGAWIFGTLFFAGFLNWTVNARVILPAVFPMALAAIRWLESAPETQIDLRFLKWAIVPTAALSLLASTADYWYADSVRSYARSDLRDLIQSGKPVFFGGHWGLQWYAEREGAKHVESSERALVDGDYMVYQADNVNIYPPVAANLVAERTYASRVHAHTVLNPLGAGFYACVRTGLPFVFTTSDTISSFRVYQVGGDDFLWYENRPNRSAAPAKVNAGESAGQAP